MIEEVADGIYVETRHLGSNNAVITTSGENVLIDAPHKPTDAARWRDVIDRLGKTRYLIHTDHHIDHTLGNSFLPGRVVAHRRTRSGMHDSYPSMSYIYDLLRVIDPDGVARLPEHDILRLPSITFTDELDLWVEGTHLRLMALSGHTPNTIGVLVPKQRVFFSGDNICEASLPSFQEANVAEWLASLHKIAELDFDTLVPGHGNVCSKAMVVEFERKVYELLDSIKAAVYSRVPEEKAVRNIRYTDRIHVGSADYTGYPDEIVESLQERSVRNIYRQLANGSIAI